MTEFDVGPKGLFMWSHSPPSRDNFTERLYENCVPETKLTLLN